MIAKILHVLRCCTISSLCHLCDVIEERALSGAQLSFIQLAFRNRPYCFFVCSLNPQEVGM